MSRQKIHRIPATFTFVGEFKVKAGSRRHAQTIVEQYAHMMAGPIQIGGWDEFIIDWDFDMHSVIEVLRDKVRV